MYPNSEVVRCLKEYGSNTVPLGLVGIMMNYAGNHLLHYIYQTYKKRIFYPCHRVISIKLLNSGDVLTTAIKKECILKKN
jgi:hypothetical protein